MKIFNKIVISFFVLTLTFAFLSLINAKSVNAQNPTCSAQLVPGQTNSCQVTSNCSAGFKANAVPVRGICTCSCIVDANGEAPVNLPKTEEAPSPCGNLPQDWFAGGDCSVKGWSTLILRLMIVIGFVYAVIMTPYVFFLFSKGTPDDNKAAMQYVNSIIYGLILLAFSATLVSVIGGSILQI